MRVRRRSATGPADACQPECIRAIKLLGIEHKVLSRAGDGIEDLLVLMPPKETERRPHGISSAALIVDITWPAYWLFIECKTIERESTGYVRYTPAQKAWRAKTPLGPRITVTGFEDCLAQLRALLGSTPPTVASRSVSRS